jgi:anti-anti-sigma regulatory factor
MRIRITRLESKAQTTFLVEGSLDFGAAQLLADVCQQAALQTEQVSIDLSGVDYLDEAGATVLRGLGRHPKLTLTGDNLFTRALLEEAEAAGDGSGGNLARCNEHVAPGGQWKYALAAYRF